MSSDKRIILSSYNSLIKLKSKTVNFQLELENNCICRTKEHIKNKDIL